MPRSGAWQLIPRDRGSRLADASLGQIHQALCRFVHRISYLY
jgi:hypothetical protein